MSSIEKNQVDELSKKSKEERGIRKDVRPPFSRVSLTTFLNLLAMVLLGVLFWYIYHAANVALDMVRSSSPGSINPLWPLGFGGNWGKSAAPKANTGAGRGSSDQAGVEGHIEALAVELGMGKGSDLAAAIADAVREHVPPASLSALSARTQETGGSRVIDALLGGEGTQSGSGSGGGIGETMRSVAGMDDAPGSGLD